MSFFFRNWQCRQGSRIDRAEKIGTAKLGILCHLFFTFCVMFGYALGTLFRREVAARGSKGHPRPRAKTLADTFRGQEYLRLWYTRERVFASDTSAFPSSNNF